MKEENFLAREVKEDRFPTSLFVVVFAVLVIMSGIHTGVVLWLFTTGTSVYLAVWIPMSYWILVAFGIVIFLKERVKKVYEEPMQHLADATRKVAGGDFSVRIPLLHDSEHLDYLDIMLTDFNKMVEELGSIETLRTDFFSNVSHEIKTPLAVIQNHTELLRKEPLGEKQRAYADTVFRAAKRLSELIGNILRLSKLEKQVIPPETERYDLCGQLAECAVSFEPLWEKKGLVFEADLEDEAWITADRSMMELVWNNLLSNAVKYTETGGSISFREWSEGPEIFVEISDTGCGMTEETKKRIFEKFYQGDTSHASAGNGLGLALVKRVLDLCGFQIEVSSRYGEGSTFTVGMYRS